VEITNDYLVIEDIEEDPFEIRHSQSLYFVSSNLITHRIALVSLCECTVLAEVSIDLGHVLILLHGPSTRHGPLVRVAAVRQHYAWTRPRVSRNDRGKMSLDTVLSPRDHHLLNLLISRIEKERAEDRGCRHVE